MITQGADVVIRGFVLPALSLLLVVGCAGQTEPELEPAVQAPLPAAETDVKVEPEEEAIDVYLQFWDAIVLASAEMDPDAPELEEYATGQALELAQFGVEAVRDEGQGMEGELVANPEIADVTREHDGQAVEVEIRDCQVGGDWRNVGTDAPDLDNVLVTASVRHDLHGWWVVEMRIWGGDTC